MHATLATLLRVALTLAALAVVAPAHAKTDCEMRFSMHGWSVFYKQATGTGTVSCTNGQKMWVKVRAKGGGLTVGKSSIQGGLGKFSEVNRMEDVLGTYADAEAHAGATKSGSAQVLTNGEITLALSGSGKGWDVGIAFGKFVISRR